MKTNLKKLLILGSPGSPWRSGDYSPTGLPEPERVGKRDNTCSVLHRCIAIRQSQAPLTFAISHSSFPLPPRVLFSR